MNQLQLLGLIILVLISLDVMLLLALRDAGKRNAKIEREREYYADTVRYLAKQVKRLKWENE